MNLGYSVAELDKTKGELERSQIQIACLLEELERYHSDFSQVKRELEEVRSAQERVDQSEVVASELNDVKSELDRSQIQIAHLLEELEHYFSGFLRVSRELEVSSSECESLERSLNETEAQLSQVRGELEQRRAELHGTQSKVERLSYLQEIAIQAESKEEMRYQQLVYEAWCAYQKGDDKRMVKLLRKSLRWTPFSQSQTVEKWLESLSNFSREKHENLDISSLTRSQPWKALIRTLMVTKDFSNAGSAGG
ncbi:MAG: hypothetical protein ACFBSC_18100 [Microcoleaceae cyanobacterium]